MRATLTYAALLIATPAHASIFGPTTVIDGDSLSVSGLSVRLLGIDAPEGKQTCNRNGEVWACGEEAASQLREIIGGRPVRCNVRGTDDFGRMLAVCEAGGIELNRTMVQSGWATAFERYSNLYSTDEQVAKASRRGIWDSSFVSPEEFRRTNEPPEHRQALTARSSPLSKPAQVISGCVIKGNRNRKGEWIYHLPGMPYYDQTRPEEMFCTEAEARAAGYRRAIVRY